MLYITLGAARQRGPALHVQTQMPTRPAADSRHSGRRTTADSDTLQSLPDETEAQRMPGQPSPTTSVFLPNNYFTGPGGH